MGTFLRHSVDLYRSSMYSFHLFSTCCLSTYFHLCHLWHSLTFSSLALLIISPCNASDLFSLVYFVFNFVTSFLPPHFTSLIRYWLTCTSFYLLECVLLFIFVFRSRCLLSAINSVSQSSFHKLCFVIVKVCGNCVVLIFSFVWFFF